MRFLRSNTKLSTYAMVALSVVLGLFFAIEWWTIMRFSPLNVDAGYYLSCAERIVEGWKLYGDFTVAYPPVGLYYFALFRTLFGEGYIVYRCALLSIEIISACLMFLLSGLVVKNSALRLLGTLLFLVICFAYEGSSICLEFFVTTFSILTILLLESNERKYLFPFLAGISFLLAVMSKQYGVAILPVVLVLLFKNGHESFFSIPSGARRAVLFLMGSLSGLLIFIFSLNINLMEFLWQISGTSYVRNGIAAMVQSLLNVNNIWLMSVMLLSITIIFRRFQFNLLLIIALFVLNLTPLYVRTYAHYYQLLLPYGVILLMVIVESFFLQKPRMGRRRFETLLMLLIGISLSTGIVYASFFPAYYHLGGAFKEYLYHNFNREWGTIGDSLELAEKINKIVPPGSRALLINDPTFSYLCKFRPPTKKNGYAFVFNENIKDFDMNKIGNIIWFDGTRVDYKTFIDTVKESHRNIYNIAYPRNHHIEIWVRN